MILTVLLAASLQSAQPMVVACSLTPEGISRNRSVPRSLTVECPTHVVEAEQLQTLAEETIERIPLNLHRRIHLQFATQIWFQWYPGDTWRAFPGQVVVGALSRPEDRVAHAGYRRQDCAYASWPDENGVPDDISITCLLNGESDSGLIRAAERSTERSVENFRYLPVPERYCTQNEFRAIFSVPGFRLEAPEDEVELPDLCDGQGIEKY